MDNVTAKGKITKGQTHDDLQYTTQKDNEWDQKPLKQGEGAVFVFCLFFITVFCLL